MKYDEEYAHWDLQDRAWYYGFSITKCQCCKRWWASRDDDGRCLNSVCHSKRFNHFYPWTKKPMKNQSTA